MAGITIFCYMGSQHYNLMCKKQLCVEVFVYVFALSTEKGIV